MSFMKTPHSITFIACILTCAPIVLNGASHSPVWAGQGLPPLSDDEVNAIIEGVGNNMSNEWLKQHYCPEQLSPSTTPSSCDQSSFCKPNNGPLDHHDTQSSPPLPTKKRSTIPLIPLDAASPATPITSTAPAAAAIASLRVRIPAPRPMPEHLANKPFFTPPAHLTSLYTHIRSILQPETLQSSSSCTVDAAPLMPTMSEKTTDSNDNGDMETDAEHYA